MINHYSENNWPAVSFTIDKFNLNPGKFCMSFGFDTDPLEHSIKKVGIINKPLILSGGNGKIEIVAGYRRILALKKMKIAEVSCFDLSDSGKTEFDMLMMNIHDNLYTRNLNNVEKSMALNRLKGILDTEELDNDIISLFGINRRELETVLCIDFLPDFLKCSIAENSISLKTLERVLELNGDRDRMVCLEWIDKLKLNYNQQLQFVEYINDISRLNKTPVHRVLMNDDYIKIYDDRKKNNPQKAKALLKNFRENLFPDLTKYEKIFKQRVNKLQLPGNMKISHARYFESEGYKLEIDFKDGRSLKSHLDYLLNTEGLERVGDPWR